MSSTEDSTILDADTDTIEKTDQPPRYNVILLNDDFTPMEFVTQLLCQTFNKSAEASRQIMLTVHHQGKAVVDQYSRDIAETLVEVVHKTARSAGYPLMAVAEPAPQP